MEAIASRLEAIASRLEAIARRLEAIASRLLLLLGCPTTQHITAHHSPTDRCGAATMCFEGHSLRFGHRMGLSYEQQRFTT